MEGVGCLAFLGSLLFLGFLVCVGGPVLVGLVLGWLVIVGALRALYGLWDATGGGPRGRRAVGGLPALAVGVAAGVQGDPALAALAAYYGVFGALWRPPAPPPPKLAEGPRVYLIPDPRWRLACWGVAALVLGAGAMWPLAWAVGAHAMAWGCVQPEHMLIALPGGVRVQRRVLDWHWHTWVPAPEVVFHPEPRWWGGRVKLGPVAVPTGALPHAWLGDALAIVGVPEPDAPARGAARAVAALVDRGKGPEALVRGA